MTSVGARLVAQLLVADGPSALPLRKLVLHSNDIDAEGYAVWHYSVTLPGPVGPLGSGRENTCHFFINHLRGVFAKVTLFVDISSQKRMFI